MNARISRLFNELLRRKHYEQPKALMKAMTDVGNGRRMGIFAHCLQSLLPAPEPFCRDGKDAFHRVPLNLGGARDAVERVLTRLRSARRVEAWFPRRLAVAAAVVLGMM